MSKVTKTTVKVPNFGWQAEGNDNFARHSVGMKNESSVEGDYLTIHLIATKAPHQGSKEMFSGEGIKFVSVEAVTANTEKEYLGRCDLDNFEVTLVS